MTTSTSLTPRAAGRSCFTAPTVGARRCPRPAPVAGRGRARRAPAPPAGVTRRQSSARRPRSSAALDAQLAAEDGHGPAGQVDVQRLVDVDLELAAVELARSPASRRRAARGRPRRRWRRCRRTSSPPRRARRSARGCGRARARSRTRRWCGWGTARVLDLRAERRRGRAPRARRGRRRGSRTAGCRS